MIWSVFPQDPVCLLFHKLASELKQLLFRLPNLHFAVITCLLPVPCLAWSCLRSGMFQNCQLQSVGVESIEAALSTWEKFFS